MPHQSPDPRLATSPGTVYLIGGVPRVGKSRIAQEVLRMKPMFSVTTDAIRSVQRNLLDRAEHPALFADYGEEHLRELCSTGRAHLVIEEQNAESEIVWPSVKTYVEALVVEGFDVLVEGVAVLPHLVSQLDCKYSAVFVGDKTLNPAAMRESARSNPLDWMHEYQDETFEAFVNFTSEFSSYFEAEAAKYGYNYVEIRDNTFEQDVTIAAKRLLGSSTQAYTRR